jgi:HEXXH motif-containing protein
MVLLRAYYDEVSQHSELLAPLPPVEAAWRALERAHEMAPDRVTALIMHPQVGSWLAYVLRRRAGGTGGVVPECVDLGQFNALALAAAAVAGQPFETRLPLREGRVMVPCFGMGWFTGCGRWGVAEARTAGGRIWLQFADQEIAVPATSGADAEGWWGLRQLQVDGDPSLTVWLEDLDPLRDLADPVAPVRLSDAEVARWSELLRDAWTILSGNPELAGSLSAGVTSLVPLPTAEGWDTRSASTGDAFGAVLCSPPPDAVTLAVSLAHEFMHIKLGGLMHLVPLVEGTGEPCLYAPWRDDPRPLGGLLQGIYAFLGIASFWRSYRRDASGTEADLAEFEYVYARAQTEEALAIVRAGPGLTPYGVTFTDGIAAELASWAGDVVPSRILALSRRVADGHRAGWRIRHCRPDPDEIATLAAAWAGPGSGTISVGGSTVLPDPAMRHWSQGRLGLARRRLAAPDRYNEARADSWGAALSDADMALFAGDTIAATKGFVEQIAEDVEAVDAWTGLGLSLGADGEDRAGVALLGRPEVVRAVYRVVAARCDPPPSPVDVAAWVGRAVMADVVPGSGSPPI